MAAAQPTVSLGFFPLVACFVALSASASARLACLRSRRTLVAVPYARAEDVGCCKIECHGPNGGGVRVTEATQSTCEASAQGCRAEWSVEPCQGAAVGGAVGADGGEREDDPPAQR
jgi:hypothetical protein